MCTQAAKLLTAWRVHPGFNFDWSEASKNERGWLRAWYSYDGKLRSYRKNKKVDAGDVCFSDGLAYFPPNETYTDWVKAQPAPKKSEEKPVCDNYKAGKDSSVKAAGRDITGIGAFTRTSHSCVAPRRMINFLVGERQIYCDFAFATMYKYTRTRKWLPVGMTYCIWCHWWIDFLRCAANLPPLYELPADLNLTGVIGMWHLLGHIRLEGEGPEPVWAHFNVHLGSTSEQGLCLRKDKINNIARGWNSIKTTEMHRALPARFRDAKKALERDLKAHQGLWASLPRKTVLDWELKPSEAEDKNGDGNWTSPLMDPVVTGGFQGTVQEEREDEVKAMGVTGKRGGQVRWMVEAIELEHSAQNLKDEDKGLGSKPSPRQANGINSKRIKLRDRVEAWMEKRSLYMPDIGEPDSPRAIAFVSEEGEWTEPVDLRLLWSYVRATLIGAGLSAMADLGERLRRGVCKDLLESVKQQLGGKAAAIKYKQTQISGQVSVTRAEAAVQAQTTKFLKSRWR
ncbi:hypothetical protein FRC12_007181 [Ceratobasidium sp. 428]|nr:hypothetical protein FRC12_007181 [Ceratobasidium sp. 428]